VNYVGGVEKQQVRFFSIRDLKERNRREKLRDRVRSDCEMTLKTPASDVGGGGFGAYAGRTAPDGGGWKLPGLLLRSFGRLTAVDPGFRTDHVLTMNLSLPGTRYSGQKDVQFFGELGRQVRGLPGVVNASTITFLPFKGMGSGTYFWRADNPRPAPGQEPVTDVRMVQPLYFETMNIPVRQGGLSTTKIMTRRRRCDS
jgi:hypothetical protein